MAGFEASTNGRFCPVHRGFQDSFKTDWDSLLLVAKGAPNIKTTQRYLNITDQEMRRSTVSLLKPSPGTGGDGARSRIEIRKDSSMLKRELVQMAYLGEHTDRCSGRDAAPK